MTPKKAPAARTTDPTTEPAPVTPMAQLRQWLQDNHARLLWASGQRVGTRSEQMFFCYALGARLLILQGYSHGGVEVFVPITASPRIDDTISALEAYKRGELIQWAGSEA